MIFMNREWEIIKRTPDVITKDSLVRDLRSVGVTAGMTLIVHSSLSRIGWVNGGPVAVVQALIETVSDDGTLVMPTHSGEYSDPVNWQNPPVPEAWWDTIRATMPAFHAAYTPTRGMGAIVDTFRHFPGVIRSSHPAVSFAAWGRYAREITDNHSLDYGLGEDSPLARLYELDASVLLLGVGYDRNTSFHLAELRIPHRKERAAAAPIMEAGSRVWKTYREIDYDADSFEEIGRAFEASLKVHNGKVGEAESRLFRQRDAVDFAAAWLEEEGANRT